MYIVGLNPVGHDSAIALVVASQSDVVTLLASHEEERFCGIRNYAGFPSLGEDALNETFRREGLSPDDIDAWVTGWDYVSFAGSSARSIAEEFPTSWRLLDPRSIPNWPIMANLKKVRGISDHLRRRFSLASFP